jgi:response regulator of citrate/malate metabolism
VPTASDRPAHEALATAIQPLLDQIGADVVPVAERRTGDIVLEWEGRPALAVRLENLSAPSEPSGLDQLMQAVATELGAPLDQLSRPLKQRAVRILEERGAFTYRRSAEAIAEALGVSRFTVYNYLNRDRAG